MDALLYFFAQSIIGVIRMLPLKTVARLGRSFGALFYWLDSRHRKVAIHNLKASFPEKTPDEVRAIARENFRRIGENYACAVKTAFMSWEDLKQHVEFINTEALFSDNPQDTPRNRVIAIGHFGNFELYARFSQHAPNFRSAATYRGLRQPSLNKLMQSLRKRSGCLFFDRRTEADALKKYMKGSGVLLGFLADQHAGRGGIRLPFLGRECSTNTAPAIFALRYRCLLHTAICFRTSLGHWRIQLNEEIPIQIDGVTRSVEDITRDINAAFEAAVRRDPANWFWVHNRWKQLSGAK